MFGFVKEMNMDEDFSLALKTTILKEFLTSKHEEL